MARNLKVFQESQPHMDLYSSPPQTDQPKDLEHQWREWIRQETIRRVIWMLFFYDTLSCLEMGVPPSICFPEVAGVPIPAPDTIWQARSATDWRFALASYRPATLDQAMRFHFHLRPGQDSQSAHQESPKDVCMLVCTDFGPFGRLVMVISLLRALLQIGQAQLRVEDSVIQTWARPQSTPEEQKLNMCTAVPLFGVALKRVSPYDPISVFFADRMWERHEQWRQGWDFDSMCATPAPGQTYGGEKTSPSNNSVSETSSILQPLRSDTSDSTPRNPETPSSSNGEFDELHCRLQGKTLFYEGNCRL
jgi:hypothetical protein